ncbi:hypothetical protein [Streptomyces sp. IMTB 2501]|nr:hypothetical protein [Streptomyces sp. IMTB 2501]
MSSEVSGVDLTRVALRAAPEAACKNGGGRTARRVRAAGPGHRDRRR